MSDAVDASRLERLAREHAAAAWRLAYAVVRDPTDAEDAVSEAFVVAARKLDASRRDDPWPWFAAVVVNVARRIRDARGRRVKREQPLDPTAGVDLSRGLPAPLEAAITAEVRERLREAIDELPDLERDALVLAHLGGLSHAEGARALRMPTGTFSSHVSRGLARLRARLGLSDEALVAALPVWWAGQTPAPAGGLSHAADRWTNAAASTPRGTLFRRWWIGAAAVALLLVAVSLVIADPPPATATADEGAAAARVDGEAGPAAPSDAHDPGRVESGLPPSAPPVADDRGTAPLNPPDEADGEAAAESDPVDRQAPASPSLLVEVVDAHTGRPVERFDVRVIAVAASYERGAALTVPYGFGRELGPHADGRSEHQLEPGSYAVAVVSPEHAPALSERVVVPETGRVRVALSPGRRVTGRILAEGSGEPIHRANVAFQRVGTAFPGAVPTGTDIEAWTAFGADAYTDRVGRFELPRMLPGPYRVRIFRPGWLTTETEVELPASRVETAFEWTAFLRLGGVVTGRIRRADGTAGANVLVRLDGDDGRTVASGFTDDDGSYRISGIPPGQYRLEAGHDGEYESRVVRVSPGTPLTEDIEPALDGVRVTGRVLRRGAPAADHPVALIGEADGGLRPSRWVRTDEQGVFTAVLMPGEYLVHSDGTLKHGEPLIVERGQGTIAFETTVPSSTVSGRVLDPDGRPLADVPVRLHTLSEPGQPLSRARVGERRTGADGRFEFPALRPRLCLIQVVPGDAWARWFSEETELRTDQDLELGDIVVAPGGGLRVRLLDEDGEPLPGRDLALELTGGSRTHEASAGRDSEWVTFTGLPAGAYVVRPWPGSRLRVTPTPVDVTAGATVELVLTARRLPYLRFAITWADGGFVVGHSVRALRDGAELTWMGSERMMDYFGPVEPGSLEVIVELPDGRTHRETVVVSGDGIVRIEIPR